MTNLEYLKSLNAEGLATYFDSCYIWGCDDCPEGKRLGDVPWFKGEKCDNRCREYLRDWLNEDVDVNFVMSINYDTEEYFGENN